jgi:hypothetical protein
MVACMPKRSGSNRLLKKKRGPRLGQARNRSQPQSRPSATATAASSEANDRTERGSPGEDSADSEPSASQPRSSIALGSLLDRYRNLPPAHRYGLVASLVVVAAVAVYLFVVGQTGPSQASSGSVPATSVPILSPGAALTVPAAAPTTSGAAAVAESAVRAPAPSAAMAGSSPVATLRPEVAKAPVVNVPAAQPAKGAAAPVLKGPVAPPAKAQSAPGPAPAQTSNAADEIYR